MGLSTEQTNKTVLVRTTAIAT